MNGAIAQLLNGKVHVMLKRRQRRLGAALIYLAGGLDPDAEDIGTAGPNWREFLDRVSKIPGISNRDLYGIGFEVDLFERVGYRARWCEHRKHWYLTDDRRRTDCPDHHWAGQKARWRASPARNP